MISGMIMTSTPVVIKSSDAECLMEIHRMEQEIQRAMEPSIPKGFEGCILCFENATKIFFSNDCN